MRSQNDLVLANGLKVIDSFTIMDKLIYSDHAPSSTVISAKPTCCLNLLKCCADGVLNDNHWDINKRRTPPLIFSKIDWANIIRCLEDRSHNITDHIQNNWLDNDQLDALITSTIYDTCKLNYKMKKKIPVPVNSINCKSANFRAIADINLYTYNLHTQNGVLMNTRRIYLENYLKYEQLTSDVELEEVNTRRNTAWRKVRNDGKKMWEMIDWKGKADLKKEKLIQESEITPYFKNIFQSEKTKTQPTIDCYHNVYSTIYYHCYKDALWDRTQNHGRSRS